LNANVIKKYKQEKGKSLIKVPFSLFHANKE